MFKVIRIFSKPCILRQSIRCIKVKKIQNKEERLKELEEKRKKQVFDALILALGNRSSLSENEWKMFESDARKQMFSCSSQNIFDAIKKLDQSKNPLEIAESYVKAMNMERNVVVDCHFIELLTSKCAQSRLSEEEEQELLQMCNELIKNDMHLLESVSSIVVNGLCATNEWRRALDFPNIHKQPSTMNILIRKAMREADIKLVWDLIRSLARFDAKEIKPKTIDKFWHFCAKRDVPALDNITKMLQLLERHERIINEAPARSLMDVLTRSNISAKIIQMDYSGKCSNCRKSLDVATLDVNNFESMRSSFMKNVVQGRDIYCKTTPEEWKSFTDLIEQNGPFDVVMDGLNIAFESVFASGSKNQPDKGRKKPNVHTLVAATEQFVNDGKRILIIGRRHMERWPRIDYIKSIAPIFLVDNVSKDDIFLLYGAMKSGPNAYILSNDFMRQHKFAIGRNYENLFKKWQQQSTYAFEFDNKDRLIPIQPMKFKMHCHQYNGQWHVPFISNEERGSFNWYALPKNWICFRL